MKYEVEYVPDISSFRNNFDIFILFSTILLNKMSVKHFELYRILLCCSVFTLEVFFVQQYGKIGMTIMLKQLSLLKGLIKLFLLLILL